MPIGYLITVLLIGACALVLLRPPRRSRLAGLIAFWIGLLVGEQPHWFALLLAMITAAGIAAGDFTSVTGWISVGLCLVVILGLLFHFSRAFLARPALRGALAQLEPEPAQPLPGRGNVAVPALLPLRLRARGVERVTDLVYCRETGRAGLLDLYRPAGGGTLRPDPDLHARGQLPKRKQAP